MQEAHELHEAEMQQMNEEVRQKNAQLEQIQVLNPPPEIIIIIMHDDDYMQPEQIAYINCDIFL
jgi:hypothetical protein